MWPRSTSSPTPRAAPPRSRRSRRHRLRDPLRQRDDPRNELQRGSDPDRRLRHGRQHRLDELQLELDHDHHPAESVNPGTVNITVTTPAGTSPVSGADQYTYTGSGGTDRTVHHQRHQRRRSPPASANVVRHHDDGDARRSASITDTAFSGCTPSALPVGITLDYTGGTTATLDGTPQPATAGPSRSASPPPTASRRSPPRPSP